MVSEDEITIGDLVEGSEKIVNELVLEVISKKFGNDLSPEFIIAYEETREIIQIEEVMSNYNEYGITFSIAVENEKIEKLVGDFKEMIFIHQPKFFELPPNISLLLFKPHYSLEVDLNIDPNSKTYHAIPSKLSIQYSSEKQSPIYSFFPIKFSRFSTDYPTKSPFVQEHILEIKSFLHPVFEKSISKIDKFMDPLHESYLDVCVEINKDKIENKVCFEYQLPLKNEKSKKEKLSEQISLGKSCLSFLEQNTIKLLTNYLHSKNKQLSGYNNI